MKSFLLTILMAIPAYGAIPIADDHVLPFQRKNYPLKDIIKDYAEALKINISYGPSINGLDKGMDLFLHKKTSFKDYSILVKSILDGHSYTLMQSGKLYWIMNTRDIRYMAGPFHGRDLPPNDDSYGTSIYVLKYPVAREVSRNLRPFLSRWGRVIDFADGRTIALIEKGETVRQMHESIKFIDTEKVFKKMLEDSAEFADKPISMENEKIVELELKNKILEKKIIEQSGPVMGGQFK